jgi:hypothetical protein
MAGGAEPDPFECLGLMPGAAPEDVRRRFRELALARHPDRVPPERRAAAHEDFVRILAAYGELCDLVGRAPRAGEAPASSGVAPSAPEADDAVPPGLLDLDDPASWYDPLEERLIAAAAHLMEGRAGEAVRVCREVLRGAPDDRRARALLAEAEREAAHGPARWVDVPRDAGPMHAHRADSLKRARPVSRIEPLPLRAREPFAPLRESRARAAAFLLAWVGFGAAVWWASAQGGGGPLGVPAHRVLACALAGACAGFALDLAALVRPMDNELVEGTGDPGGAPLGVLLLVAGGLNLALAAVFYAVHAALSERWSGSVLAMLGVAAVCGGAGAAAEPEAWRGGLALLPNAAWLGALAGWLAAGFLRASPFE